MAEQFTAKFKVDITDLKKNITEATKQIKLANATFKKETAGMDSWSKSADGLAAKLKQLKSDLEAQKSILSSYQGQLKKQQEAYEENGKRAEQLKAKLKELAEQGVSKSSEEYQKYEKALKQVLKEQQNNGKAVEDLNMKVLEQETAVKTTEGQISKYTASLDKLETEQRQAAEAANKQSTAYEKLESTIDAQQENLDALKKKYADVVLEQGKNSDTAKELAAEIDKLSSELKDNKNELTNASKAADDLDNSLDEVDPEDKAKGFTVLKGALANLVADGIRLAIDAVKDFAKETINIGKEFDSSMSQVGAVSGATGEELQALRDKAKEMGAATKFSASESADAFNYMAMAGWKTEDMLNGISGILSLAAAGNTDLARTSDIVTDALTAFGKTAGDAGRLADIMAAASSNANTNVEMMGETFKYVAPVAGAMGYSMEDTSVAIGLMANAGIKGTQAGTALRSVLSRLAAPPKEAAEAMADLGIEITNTDGTMKPLSEVIGILREKFDGLSEAEQTSYAKHLAGQEAMSGLLAIVNAAPADVNKLTDAINNSNGAAERMAETMQDNLGGDLTKFGSQLEGVQIAIYEKFEPALRKGVEALSKLLDAFMWVIDNGNTIAAVIIGVGTAVGTFLTIINRQAIMTAFFGMLTKIKTAFLSLNAVMAANPIGLVVAAIAGLIAAFVYLWNTSEDFRNFWIGLWDKIKEVASAAWDAISGFFSEAWDKVKEIWGGLTDFFSGLWDSIKDIFSTIADWINTNVFQPIMDFFEPVITFFKEAWQIITVLAEGSWEIIKKVWEIVSEWFSTNVIQPVKQFFSDLWTEISTAASKAWDSIVGVWELVSGWFDTNVIQPVKTFFSDAWDSLVKGASDAWTGIKTVFKPVVDWFSEKFSAAWTAVKKVFSTGGKIFDGIKEGITAAFKKVVNAIIGGINKVIAKPFNAVNKALDKIRAVNILGLQPFKNLGSISVPQIPKLATGGVLKRGQVGLLEGNGAEAVVPLERNKQWIRAVANDLLRELRNEAGGATVSNNTNSVNRVNNFTQIINAPKQPSRIELYRQTKNLLAYATVTGG